MFVSRTAVIISKIEKKILIRKGSQNIEKVLFNAHIKTKYITNINNKINYYLLDLAELLDPTFTTTTCKLDSTIQAFYPSTTRHLFTPVTTVAE